MIRPIFHALHFAVLGAEALYTFAYEHALRCVEDVHPDREHNNKAAHGYVFGLALSVAMILSGIIHLLPTH